MFVYSYMYIKHPFLKRFVEKKNPVLNKHVYVLTLFHFKIQSKVNIHVCLPYLSNKILNFLSQSSYQQNNGYPCFDLKLEDNS